MTCAFCGLDPYHREDVGPGLVPVAVNCCELGILAYGRGSPDDEATVTAAEVREIATKIAGMEWQIERRNRFIAKLWPMRVAASLRKMMRDSMTLGTGITYVAPRDFWNRPTE